MVPLGVVAVQEPAQAHVVEIAGADVVDQDVEAAELRQRRPDRGCGPLGRRQICGDGGLGHFCQLRRDGPGSPGNADPLGGQRPGDGQPDSPTGAGDECGLSLKV